MIDGGRDLIHELSFEHKGISTEYILERSLSEIEFESFRLKLLETGICIVSGVPINDLLGVRRWFDFVPGDVIEEYKGGTNEPKNTNNAIFTFGSEPPQANVSAHNEMSYTFFDGYPGYFIMGCVSAPASGGDSLLGDNIGITNALVETDMGSRLLEHGVRYIRNFYDESRSSSSSIGLRSWQEGLMCQSRSEAEKILTDLGICDFKWQSDGGLYFHYTKPAFEWHSQIKQDLCFFSIGNHGYWFRNWPPFNELPNIRPPFHLTYGDGSELTEEDLSLFAKISVENSRSHHWRAGDIIALDNLRFTHGRKPFSIGDDETRKIGVLMKDLRHRQGCRGTVRAPTGPIH